MSDEIEDWKPPMPTIPNGWVAANFEDAFENVSVNGKKIKQKEYLEEGALPVVDQGAQLIGGYTNNHQSRIKIKKPVIVFGDHTRCFKYINFDFAPGADGVKVLLPQEGLDSTFLYYLCKILKLPNRGYSRHYSFLKKSVLPVAPLNEQKRIVDKIEQLFSDLDEGEALLKTVQKQLATYRQSVLKAAVTGELTKDWREKNKKKLESGEKLLARILESRKKNWQGRGQYKEEILANLEQMPEIPEGWVWCSLGQLTSFITSGSRGWAEYYSESGSYFFRSQNVTKAGLSMDDIAYVNPPQNSEGERTKLCADDLLVSITGNPGNVAIIPELDADAYISQHVCLARPVDVKTASYLEIIIRSWPIQKYFERVQYGLTKPGLNLTQVAECPIPLPSKAEQEEIITRIEDVFSKIDICEALCTAELSRSKTLRQSILKSAFSGKLVAQDSADEPASALLARIKSGDNAKEKPKAKGRRRKPRSDKTKAA